MNFTRRFLQLFGYDILKISKYHPSLETHLKTVLHTLDVGVVIDVGANNGGYGRTLRQLGFKGRIVSFEPVKNCFDDLTRISAHDPDWHCHNFALGAEKKQMTIHVPSSSDFASFLTVSDKARQIWNDDFSKVVSQEVQIQRLDEVFQDLILPLKKEKSIFLKMDTQGFDLEVIKGGQGILDQITGLQSELSVFPIYDQMPDYITAFSLFKECGFEVSGIYPVSRDRETLTVVEFDCVMLRPQKAGAGK